MSFDWKKQFFTIYIGQAFSILGSAAVQFAIIWWLTVQTESAITLTTATIVGVIPNMVLGPFAGVWIDRFNRKLVMIAADSLSALASAALGISFLLTSTPPIWFVYVIMLLRGVSNTFHSPAMQAAIPTLVPADMLTKVGGWSQLVGSMSNMIGPILGAALMVSMSITTIMLVDIVGAAFAVVCLLFVKIPDIHKPAEKQRVFSDIKQGFLAIKENKPLVALFPGMILASISFMPLVSLYPLFVRTQFNGLAWHTGIVEFVFTGGLLVSSLVLGVWGGMKRRFLMVSLFIILMGLASTISGLLPQSAFWLFAILSFVMGTTGTFITVPLMAYAQQTIAPDKMGKVFSLIMTASTMVMPAGLLFAGPVSEIIGVAKWFRYSGLLLMFTGVLCYFRTRKYELNIGTPRS